MNRWQRTSRVLSIVLFGICGFVAALGRFYPYGLYCVTLGAVLLAYSSKNEK